MVAARRWGHTHVRALLQAERLPAGFEEAPLVCQAASLGTLDAPWLEQLLEQLLDSFCARHPGQQALQLGGTGQGRQQEGGGARDRPPLEQRLHFVWPTVEEVRCCSKGWSAGHAIPGTHNNLSRQFLQGLFCRWVQQADG
jgi:hypothetical protein